MRLEVLLDIDEAALAEADWLPSHDFLADWARHALAGVVRPDVDADVRPDVGAGPVVPDTAASPEGGKRGGTAVSCRELSVRYVGQEAMRRLNRDWRGRDAPTNVLSFPSGMPPPTLDPGAEETLVGEVSADEACAGDAGAIDACAVPSPVFPLGDLAICPAVVRAEARAQGKSPEAHWAHMIVHGVLHLAGLDHEDESEALVMERLESRLLSERAIPDPYGASGASLP